MRFIPSLVIMALFAIITTQSFAQSTTVQATGTVLEPLAVSGSNLNFGTSIFPGTNESVDRMTDANAARFDITGAPGAEVSITFTLPTNLVHTTDATATMPVVFSGTDAGYYTLSDGQALATGFDPSATTNASLGSAIADSGQLFIWLGGTVQPTTTQLSGDYAADITLDLAYTGN